jgi:hypothetical protein
MKRLAGFIPPVESGLLFQYRLDVLFEHSTAGEDRGKSDC